MRQGGREQSDRRMWPGSEGPGAAWFFLQVTWGSGKRQGETPTLISLALPSWPSSAKDWKAPFLSGPKEAGACSTGFGWLASRRSGNSAE